MKPIPSDVQSILDLYTYEVTEQLNDWDTRERFFVYKLTKAKKYFTLKVANSGLEQDLANEVWWNACLLRFDEANPAMKVRAPKIELTGPNFYIGEFFNTKPLIENGFKIAIKHVEPLIPRLAKMLVDLDGIAFAPVRNNKPKYENTNSAPYTNLAAKLNTWMVVPLQRKQITPARIEQGKRLIEKYQQYTVPKLQHGDFVPWHMFDLDNDEVGIIDGEHASLTKPRLYDLAYLYARLVTRMKSFEVASELLKSFVGLLDEDLAEIKKAWLPVITLRSLGAMYDAEVDLDRLDYRDQAQELLNRCFEEKLNVFMEV